MKYLSIGIIIVLVLGAATFAFLGSRPVQQEQPRQQQTNTADIQSQTAQQQNQTAKPMENKLISEDIKAGTGAEAKIGNTVSVQYTGTLLNGTKFDSSYDRGQPFSFVLGAGQVIQGWDQGVVGMKVGGKRKLTIPPSLAYGDRTVSPLIPANSTLVFEIELLGIK